MRLNHEIKFLVTKTEKKRLKTEAEKAGFTKLSPYVRWLVETPIRGELEEIKFLLKNGRST